MEPLYASYILDCIPTISIINHAENLKSQYPHEKLGLVCLDANNVSTIDSHPLFDVFYCVKRKQGCFCFTEAEFRGRVREVVYKSSKIFLCAVSPSFAASTIKLAQNLSIPYEVLKCL